MAGKKVLCGKCKKEIGKGGSVQCDKCTEWLHLRCAEMSELFCSSMSKQSGVYFKCIDCRSAPNNSTDLSQQISQLHIKLDAISNQLTQHKAETENIIETSICNLRAEFTSRLERIEADVVSCYSQVKGLDTSVENKMKEQEAITNVIYHRANRTDIVINGLPTAISNLENIVVDLCSFYGISIDVNDIQHVCFMNKSKSILVKFKRVRIRDNLMAEYHKSRSLKLSDLISGDVHSRVYLNDHFAPMAAKMNFMCKQMLMKKIIKKYKIYNADIPRVTISYEDGSYVTKEYGDCEKLFAEVGV
ncbi:hypothetical protein FF38_12482 [Lucilia cuprina]|uniref:Phorbol-ester/DAG-type domain-containing protein n=1 Tax=Lucilia cuprina TaxID=7375 RepID=A0A0L0CIB3_LUCCU|nr:hypothetical protein FF38_12482 [Lucilia cuprina]